MARYIDDNVRTPIAFFVGEKLHFLLFFCNSVGHMQGMLLNVGNEPCDEKMFPSSNFPNFIQSCNHDRKMDNMGKCSPR